MIEWIKLGLSVLSFIGSIAVFVYVRADRQQRATVKSIEELRESVDARFSAKCARLAKLETDMGRIPSRIEFESAQDRSRGEIVRLHERIDELNKYAQTTNLLVGQVLGELKQLNKGINHG